MYTWFVCLSAHTAIVQLKNYNTYGFSTTVFMHIIIYHVHERGREKKRAVLGVVVPLPFYLILFTYTELLYMLHLGEGEGAGTQGV